MDDYDGTRGDAWFTSMQAIQTQVAYMALPGNHERAANFSHYRNVFSMPGNTESLYWSLDVGLVHLIAIDTETFHYNSQSVQDRMTDWLWADLKKANNNRAQVPWIIVMGHRYNEM